MHSLQRWEVGGLLEKRKKEAFNVALFSMSGAAALGLWAFAQHTETCS